MLSVIEFASAFIGRHHEWAAAVLGVMTFLESLVLLGAFFPATALMLLAGGLLARGMLDPTTVIVACVTGAVLGDTLSFTIGRRLGRGAFRHPILARHRRMVARTRLYCRRFGGASIFIGRFLGPMRAVVPMVAGMLRMRRRRFYLATVISALTWVVAMLAPGYLAARGLARLAVLGPVEGPALAVAGVAVLAVVAVVGAHFALSAWRRRGGVATPAAR
jgi:membrane protein DedA with SNARE-associated domain